MSTYYIKKGDRFLDRNGRQMQYGTPIRFRSSFDAWKWICSGPIRISYRLSELWRVNHERTFIFRSCAVVAV